MSWLPKFSPPARAGSDDDVSTVGPIPETGAVILLVEDEPAVRGLFALSLRKDGYFVLEASNGAEALTVVEQAGRVSICPRL